MEEKEIRVKLKSILLNNFEVNPLLFDWDVPLEDLQQKFSLLGYLVFFEQLINEHFEGRFHILENINAAIHTPNDVCRLIQEELITNL
ncbi:MAG: hypothetical protein U5K51_11760 [Flavobacteriaceae bacterium]|nr:hypothetical protein [Flavobacteriaceae bacterium]